MQRILMVCLGNICRSPMAEGIFRDKSESLGLNFEFDSAGTANYHVGEEPDHRAVRCLREHGIDISNLRARQFHANDFAKFDIIYVMDATNCQNVLALAKSESDRNKVKMILNEIRPGENQPVPDPWFGGPSDFESVYEMLIEAAEKVLTKK